ncbi:hypothetical protein [Nocardia sp. NPDC050718]|uniref:hypothetical protein n=1 Tax=Nocardia sp. NPDC050718 TaxID=3155788 RepID=UPI00340CD2BA
MADATDDQFRACLNLLEPADSARVLTADSRVRAATWGRIPRTYIRLSQDRAIPPHMQDRMIAEADALTPDNPFTVHTVAASHLGACLHAARIAAILDAHTSTR